MRFCRGESVRGRRLRSLAIGGERFLSFSFSNFECEMAGKRGEKEEGLARSPVWVITDCSGQ